MATNAQIIAQAAARYGVPNQVLLGVYGAETDFGRIVNTSSAGAMGSFQFIRGTAASYGYPYTNATDAATFTAQANAAAHYLSDLFHQTGSWESALQHYSGGGYGLAHVQSEAAQAPAGMSLSAGSSNPVSQSLNGAASAQGAGVLSVQHQSELLYGVVWVGALIMGAWLLLSGINRSTSGAPARALKATATTARVVAK